MIDKKTVTAIILIAGNSTRFGKNTNKNFETIDGKTILTYSLEAFDRNIYIDNIIIAVKECEMQEVKKIINKQKLAKNIDIVIGGNTRKQSVYNCIKSTNSDIVIIHDGARPLIKQEYITNCIENMKDFKGVTIGRGSVIAGAATVLCNVPPYSVYISKDKIYPRFSKEQIQEHENILYRK